MNNTLKLVIGALVAGFLFGATKTLEDWAKDVDQKPPCWDHAD